MPPTDLISPYPVACQGGLVLDTSVLAIPPGAATELVNMEPDINGGYRKINGFTPYSSTALSGTGGVKGLTILGSTVIGCRGTNVEKGTGGTWTSVTGARNAAEFYTFDKYNWSGTETIVGADGANYPFTYDLTTYTLLNGALGTGSGTAPINPELVVEFKGRLFFARYDNLSGSGSIAFTAPYSPNDFLVSSGAGEIKVGDEVMAIKVFRDTLYILCRHSIYRLSGSSPSDYVVLPVTRDIGCISSRSVQEVGGDIIFLAPDGLRTIAGTDRVDDIALDNISKSVQKLFSNIASASEVSSVVIRGKSQYRLFFSKSGTSEAATKGVISAMRRNYIQGAPQLVWEHAETLGVKPSVCTSDYIGDTEIVLHGDYDGGFVYQQESGNSFNGATIISDYRSPDLTMGDPGLRKILQRVILNYQTEGSVSFDLLVKLDYEDLNVLQPSAITITDGGASAAYGSGVYGTATYGLNTTPLLRQTAVGTGFAIAIDIHDNSTNPSFAVRGFSLEAVPGGRR